MAISNEQLQEKLMDMLRVLESADPATKELDEFKALSNMNAVGVVLSGGNVSLDKLYW